MCLADYTDSHRFSNLMKGFSSLTLTDYTKIVVLKNHYQLYLRNLQLALASHLGDKVLGINGLSV